MSLTLRVISMSTLLVVLAVAYLARDASNRLLPQLRSATEVVMYDSAVYLATFVEDTSDQKIAEVVQRLANTPKTLAAAQIYDLEKSATDLRIYITNRDGHVLFHSFDQSQVGKDYSKWNDVYRTIRGQYGARTTRDNPEDPTSTVMYVAAPIIHAGQLVGVLTVGKPQPNINELIGISRRTLIQISIALLLSLAVVIVLLSRWILRPITALTNYAQNVSQGVDAQLPKLSTSEFRTLGSSFESMRRSLEDKKYIESYIQTLTHEIRAPLAGIRGAAEVLQEHPAAPDHEKFVDNILAEGSRIGSLVDRLLELAGVEHRKELGASHAIDLSRVLTKLALRFLTIAQAKGVTITTDITSALSVTGDEFLLTQAVGNLLQNAIDFSPRGNAVHLKAERSADEIVIKVIDQGSGIPPLAGERIFEKFFSLPRPDSGRKSSGLGLPFVKRVAELHAGRCEVRNNSERGVTAKMVIPQRP